jgi:hypothetical protein
MPCGMTKVTQRFNLKMQDQNNIWNSWFNHAKDFAGKAQELAETAGKIAQEKAAVLAKQAQDLRQNYDMEVKMENIKIR